MVSPEWARPRSEAGEALGMTMRSFELTTLEPIQLIDITDIVTGIVRRVGLRDGTVTVYSRHTTASIRIQEAEPLLLEDFREFLERVAPRDAAYRHNDFEIRTEHMHDDEPPNGHSHCLAFLLGTSETIPVVEGRLMLGTWQRIFFVELDGPRPSRSTVVQLTGHLRS